MRGRQLYAPCHSGSSRHWKSSPTRDLPSLLIVKVSQPSESPGELYRYFAEFGSDRVAHNYTRVDFGPAESFCEFDRVRLRKCT